MKQRLLSGIKPSGKIHIGNYFGAMKQFVDLQNEYESFIFIADYHALNQVQDPRVLRDLIFETAKTFLAIGLDPSKTTLYKQSDISNITEFTWILNSITPIALLQRAHAYKDARKNQSRINMGLFDYPVLMSADILICDTDIVPVGQDQVQHVEIAREIARLFNSIYGNTLKLPQERLNNESSCIPGFDGRKMSKSYNNTIGLFDDEKSIRKKVLSIVTDSKTASEPKNPETCSVFAFHKLFSAKQLPELTIRYKNGSISYKESKDILYENIITTLAPIRAKKYELDHNPLEVMKILGQGKERVKEITDAKMKVIREKIGVSI